MSAASTASGGTARLWSRIRGFLLPRNRRHGDRGAMAARVGGGVTGLAVMAGIAFISTMCGPGEATASGLDSTGSGSSGGVIQASASSSSGEKITISRHGERGSYAKDRIVNVSVPEDILRIHRTAAEAYDLPWELLAGLSAIETQNGAYGNVRVEGSRNEAGAAGIVQFGVQDPQTGAIGAASNAWGGKPKEPVADRLHHYEVGELPETVNDYFGIDGNGDGTVNVWDPADNITSGAFRLAYYKREAERNGRCNRYPGLTPIECTLYIHNPGRAPDASQNPWYAKQVMDVVEYYQNSGIAPTSPSLNVQTVAASGGEDCSQGSGVNQAAFLGNASEAHRRVVEFAREQLGDPYVWAANGPDAWDCSGLTKGAFAEAGMHIPRTTTTLWNLNDGGYTNTTPQRVLDRGDALDVSVLQPGDLVFFHTIAEHASPSHVGIYAGGGRLVHAGNPVKDVPLDDEYWRSRFVGAIRVIPNSSGDDGPQTADV